MSGRDRGVGSGLKNGTTRGSDHRVASGNLSADGDKRENLKVKKHGRQESGQFNERYTTAENRRTRLIELRRERDELHSLFSGLRSDETVFCSTLVEPFCVLLGIRSTQQAALDAILTFNNT